MPMWMLNETGIESSWKVSEIVKKFAVLRDFTFGSIEAAMTSYDFLYIATGSAIHVFESNL